MRATRERAQAAVRRHRDVRFLRALGVERLALRCIARAAAGARMIRFIAGSVCPERTGHTIHHPRSSSCASSQRHG